MEPILRTANEVRETQGDDVGRERPALGIDADDEESDTVFAVIENRAKEVGVAVINLATLNLTLNQFIESSRGYEITKRYEWLPSSLIRTDNSLMSNKYDVHSLVELHSPRSILVSQRPAATLSDICVQNSVQERCRERDTQLVALSRKEFDDTKV